MNYTQRQLGAMQRVINRMARWDLQLYRGGRIWYSGRWALGDMPKGAYVGEVTLGNLVGVGWVVALDRGTYVTRWGLSDEGRCAADPGAAKKENVA